MGSKRPLMVGGVLVFGIACFAFIALILFGDRLPGLIFKHREHPRNSLTNKVEKIESLIVPSSIGDTTSSPEPEVRRKRKKSPQHSTPSPSTTTSEWTNFQTDLRTSLGTTQEPKVENVPSPPNQNSSFIPTDVSNDDDSEEYSDEETDNWTEDSPQGKESPIGKIIHLATTLYNSRPTVGDIEGFIKVMNETVRKGKQDEVFSHLNEVYSREGSSSLGDHETSLAAFVFMSIGVFLLNQIHKIIEKENVSSPRGFNHNFPTSGLDVLFSPKEGKEEPNGVNNMFRAMLNLGNAYVKDSQSMECIWALYCEDLDKTGANEGLYGIASRINSIGLRLIMDQIPTEMTLDMMVRSILGWDGLPCKKMFPKCEGNLKEKLIPSLPQHSKSLPDVPEEKRE